VAVSETRVIIPVDEQRVREIIREELAAAEAAKPCPRCHLPRLVNWRCADPYTVPGDCPFVPRAL
jgi:hypothetical protein